MIKTNRHKKISRGFPIYTCRGCKKNTRIGSVLDEDAYWVELCVDCYEDANMENAHNDGNHEDASDPDCKYCK